VVSVLVQYAPHGLRDAAWDDAQREALADRAIALLSEYAPNLPGLVLGRQVITPADLEREYGFPGGSIHHSDPTLDQRFVMRPVPGWGGYRTPVPGLYLGGAGAHPGGGLTGIPGKNAARQVLRDMRRRE
jgi:phytoene dehydrogenase-like protein